jgi:ABC-type antimicrobial peptide transport system permease subunit
MGLRISFLENNAVAFWDIMEPLQNARLIAVIAYTLLLILTLSLSAYLYLLRRRKEFAIMRSLGVPLRVVKKQLFMPIALIGGVGIAVGGFTAWRFALMQIEEVMAGLPTGRFEIPTYEPPSALLLAVLYIAVFLLLLLCLLIGVSGMSKRPVLELLQGGNYAGYKKRDREHVDSVTFSAISGGDMSATGKNVFISTAYTQKGYNSLRSYIASGWFVLNKIIRTPLKTILTLAVAVMFVLTLGYISLLVERNETEIERLYSIVDIEAEITVGGVSVTAGMVATIPKAMIDAVRDSGFIAGTNVQMGLPWTITSRGATAGVVAHAIDRPDMLTGIWRNISIEYAQGWDETFFALDFGEAETIPIAVSADIQAQLGLMPGDEVVFRVMRDEGGVLYSFNVIIAAVYTKNSVSGIITVMEKDNTVLIPFSMTELVSDRFLYNRAYFMIDPTQNREIAASTAELDRIIRDTRGNAPLSLVLWDEELRLVTQPMERTLSLLEALYPVILMASTMVPAGLAALMILQVKKLAAILRVLGTTRARVIAMQSSEQIVVCLAGLVLVIITALVFLGTTIALSSSSFTQAALYLFGAFIGSVFAAIIATRKSPMELLQTKE